MAGSNPDDPAFAADFRTNIAAVMTMGLPEDVALRPTFLFPLVKTFVPAARDGAPWDWTQSPTDVQPDPPRASVQVPCAVEPQAGAAVVTSVGQFDATRAILTFLDEHWSSVFGFYEVLLGGDRYAYVRQLPPIGLFDVTVHQVLVAAVDET